jgi:RNase P subunit RPR2
MEFHSYDVPALICENCIKDLKIAIKFRNRARSSDKSYFRDFSFDVEELSWNKKLIKLKNTENEFDPSIKCETIVEEYLESDQEVESAKINSDEMIIEEIDEKDDKSPEKSSEKIFSCEFCMQILSTKKSLEYHLKVKHNHDVGVVFACEVRFNL